MGAVMGAGRALELLLLPVMLLTMPGAQANCGETEYSHQGLCCVFCEAGTFVADHCNASHLRGKCDPCKEGKEFTPHANSLEECLPCRQCKEDQITLRSCTQTQNAECQCKQGYFCADEGCERCQRNSEMHPDGKEVVLNSTDATDPSLPNQAASTGEDAEGGLVQELNEIIVKDLSQSELSKTFDVFIKEVPPQQWKQLMKTQLQENDIDKIISKFPNNRDENPVRCFSGK
ncbi:tumor necrosis factor receptor superfamily member 26-like isoform X2 [Cyanistes caeruleus]|uniref:tumor necrosis factor receptor superfamily member 26-like isoform X2 n=1 Tax=Cyanistes caeruleus TaxID=156563 RepID=UPI000CDA3E82|nr:tumor necrosis factor receptor superfamily member 26-like isoform X2 [Cyanistes caeruleus]